MPELTISKSVLLTDYGFCINRYRHSTPGIYVCYHVPVELDEDTRFVPGLISMVNHGRLKQCEPIETAFKGPPNFVLDVFDDNELDEYESRKQSFAKHGVTEYVVLMSDQNAACHWHRHNGTDFDLVTPDENGILKSKSLPGLWFSTSKISGTKDFALVDSIARGVTRVGHHEFMETIFHKEGRDPDWKDWLPFDAG